MNDTQSKRKTDDTDMDLRDIADSIKRIEDDLYFSADNIKVRLARIEEKLEHVATRDDLDQFKVTMRDDMDKFKVTMRDDMDKMNSALRDDMDKMNSALRDDMAGFKSDTRSGMAKLNTKVERLRMDMELQKTELIAHMNTQFRWTVGLLVSVAGVIVTVLKLI